MIQEKTIKVEKEEKIVVKAFCSFCGKEFNECTTSCNGFGQLHISFGFGSGFDDSCFTLEICDDCFLKNYFELLKDQFKQKEYNLNKLSDKFKTLTNVNPTEDLICVKESSERSEEFGENQK